MSPHKAQAVSQTCLTRLSPNADPRSPLWHHNIKIQIYLNLCEMVYICNHEKVVNDEIVK